MTRVFVWVAIVVAFLGLLWWQRDRDYLNESDVVRARKSGGL